MKKIKLILILFFYSSYGYSVPTIPGNCDITNFKSYYVGKGFIWGPPAASGNESMGHIDLSFDYVCKPWNNTNNMRIGTYGLTNSYGAGEAYRSNTWGMVLMSHYFSRTTVLSQGNNLWLKKFNANEIGSDGLLRGTFRSAIFDLDKNGNIGNYSNSSNRFSPGSTRKFSLVNPFNILFVDADSGYYTNLVTNFKFDLDIYVYDPTCTITSPSSVNIGDLPIGSTRTKTFKIALSCVDAATANTNVMTKFTESSSDLTYSSNKEILKYSDNNGVKVDMHLTDSNGKIIVFDEFNEYKLSDPSQKLYNINYVGKFKGVSGSSLGSFSFPLNFEITYN